MPDAVLSRKQNSYLLSALQTYDGGQLFQLPTGEAAFIRVDEPVASGDQTEDIQTDGKVTLEKTTGVVFLPGQEIWWDHSARKAHYKRVNDRDFLAGIASDGASSSAITVLCDLNKRCKAFTSLLEGNGLSATNGTHAVGANGFGYPKTMGKTRVFQLSSTNEAQRVDLMGVDCFDPAAKWIAEYLFKVVDGGSGSAPDVNIGMSNGTHATDFDSVTERISLHIDGNSVNLNLGSTDGSTVVAYTDTTIDYSAGSAVANRVHLLIDGRTLTDIQCYLNGAIVLSSTVFKLDAAAGPLRLICHAEKTAAADTFELHLEEARVWYAEQGEGA